MENLVKEESTDINNADGVSADAVKPKLEIAVTDIIHAIGIPANLRGYKYLREAIILSVNNINSESSMTKLIYPAVAKKHGVTASRVERAMRHAIKVAWERGNKDVLNSYFGSTTQRKQSRPTNSEFIALISDKIWLEFKHSLPISTTELF